MSNILALLERSEFEDGCLVWKGPTNRDGYGKVNAPDTSRKSGWRHWLVHRRAYTLRHGDPGPLKVMHTCDNPPCWLDDHLVAGTQADNISDCAAKGRRNQRRPIKLTFEMAEEIRALVGRLDFSQGETAKLYGVTQTMVSSIVRGKTGRRDDGDVLMIKGFLAVVASWALLVAVAFGIVCLAVWVI